MHLSNRIIANVEKVLLGKPAAVRLAVACFMAEGHLLIDDIPGVGKTTLALALANSIGLSFQRIQFTSDLLPSDVLGVSVYNPKTQGFDFKKGPIFHNVVLADEINRASPKTQSALLESMQEGQVSLDNATYDLPKPFFVIATQNPHEHHGTFPLPESQLDRFMMRVDIGYPDEQAESEILKGSSRGERINQLAPVGALSEVADEIKKIRDVKVDDSLDRYIIEIAKITRRSSMIDLGLSPRGALALRKAAQAIASIEGRDYLIPDDIKKMAVPVMGHRLKIKGGHFNGNSSRVVLTMIHEIIDQVPVPT